MTRCDRRERGGIRGDDALHRDSGRGSGSDRRRPYAALEDCPFADYGAGTDFGDRLSVYFDIKDAVDDQVQLVSGLALHRDSRTGFHLAELGLRMHEFLGELPLDRAGDLRDEWRVLEAELNALN